MTESFKKTSLVLSMRFHSLLLIAACLLAPAGSAHATEPPPGDLLRDGLYAEEVTRDPAAAATQYEQLLTRYTEQRDFAATALFRLAEVRRKQDRKEDAIKLYQRLLAEFPASPAIKLAKENLTALGVEPLAKGIQEPPPDEDSLEFLRLQKMAKSSPDLIRKDDVIRVVVEKGWERSLDFLLDEGITSESAMYHAVRSGQLAIVKMLIARGVDLKGEIGARVLGYSIDSKYREIVKTLLDAGALPNGFPSDSPLSSTPLIQAVRTRDLDTVQLLITQGADVNQVSTRWEISFAPSYESAFLGAPLHLAILTGQTQMIELLLANKADVNLAEPRSKVTTLWLAAGYPEKAPGLVKRLLDLGADPDTESADAPESWPSYFGKRTPLELAVSSGIIENVKLLLEAKLPQKLPLSPTILHDAVGHHEITKLLLDYGAEANPPKLKDRTLLESWASGSGSHHATSPSDPVKTWQLIEFLIERGSKDDAEWEEAGFPSIDPSISGRLKRKFSYPRWALEKRLLIVDTELDMQIGRIAGDSRPQPKPPMLEEWLLQDETSFLADLAKDFTYFALIRMTSDGMKEIAILRLNGDELFPQLAWGDILEKRSINRPGSQGSSEMTWTQEVRDALQKRIKVRAGTTDMAVQGGQPWSPNPSRPKKLRSRSPAGNQR